LDSGCSIRNCPDASGIGEGVRWDLRHRSWIDVWVCTCYLLIPVSHRYLLWPLSKLDPNSNARSKSEFKVWYSPAERASDDLMIQIDRLGDGLSGLERSAIYAFSVASYELHHFALKSLSFYRRQRPNYPLKSEKSKKFRKSRSFSPRDHHEQS
jgi:hypothetical protein